MLLMGCSSNGTTVNPSVNKDSEETLEIPDEEKGDDTPYEYTLEFDSLDDENLLEYTRNKIYSDVVDGLINTEYFVENVEIKYISKEYI